MISPQGLVLAHGVYDVLHVGHLAFLEAAKGYGDRLIVSLTDDEFVTKQKGPGHPYFSIAERMRMVRALGIVDGAVVSHAEDAVDVIHSLKPSAFVKGSDYSSGDPSGRLDRERAAVERWGGRLVILNTTPRYSSTALLKALSPSSSEPGLPWFWTTQRHISDEEREAIRAAFLQGISEAELSKRYGLERRL